MEQQEPANPDKAGDSSPPGRLEPGRTDGFYDEVRVVVQALHRLDISNGRLRVHLAKELGISVTELNALTYVSTNEEMTPKDLAGELGITTGSVTAMIDRLEKTGFILRHPNPLDRRSLLLKLTPAGDHAMDWVYAYFHKAIATSLPHQSGTSQLALTEFLDHAAAAMAELSLQTDTTNV